jgi:nitrite reductase (NADH) small subunit
VADVKRAFVARAEDFPPGTMRFVAEGKQGIGVYNVNGEYYALSNYCPHRGAPLCLGPIEGAVKAGGAPYQLEWERDKEFVRCPWHGWEFEIASGEARARSGHRARSWKVIVDDGAVYVEGV